MVRLEKCIDDPLNKIGIINIDLLFWSGPYVKDSVKISAQNLE